MTAQTQLVGQNRRKPAPLGESHFMTFGRAFWLTVMLVAANVGGGLFVAFVVPSRAQYLSSLKEPLKLVCMLGAFATVLSGTPLITFLSVGWFTRYQEFQNSLKEKALSAYLQRFWSQRLIHALEDAGKLPPQLLEQPPSSETWRIVADKNLDLCDRLFARIYHEQYGLSPFVPPFAILLLMSYAAAGLIGWNSASANCPTFSQATCVYGLSQQLLVASLAGAFMFVVSDSVLSIRRKSLNVSDVYWYSLRLFLAVPLALVANVLTGTDGPHTALAFSLGTFPVDALLKIVRRMGFPQFTEVDKEENQPDKLLTLEGVTLPVVATFEAEGINSVEQVAAADPVLLSIRTGFPFRFTLRLGSQAIVRRHFGENAAALIPIGLCDVVSIYLLVKAADGTTSPQLPAVENVEAVLQDAAARLFPADDKDQRLAVVKMKFRQIAAEEYTLMLALITPLDPAL
ncbi:hypothetical protein P3T40_002928 [Paraburkholderia sp. EB58]|uniref:hypothetical protein n=1 Tax=Paraburkholderia sp. EB58 TaxID=3035125 RepID=UPI003D22D302